MCPKGQRGPSHRRRNPSLHHRAPNANLRRAQSRPAFAQYCPCPKSGGAAPVILQASSDALAQTPSCRRIGAEWSTVDICDRRRLHHVPGFCRTRPSSLHINHTPVALEWPEHEHPARERLLGHSGPNRQGGRRFDARVYLAPALRGAGSTRRTRELYVVTSHSLPYFYGPKQRNSPSRANAGRCRRIRFRG